MERTCIVCGKTFENKYAQTKTCSPECSREYRLQKHREYNAKTARPATTRTKQCDKCGKEFSTTNPTQRFCSALCRIEYYEKKYAGKPQKGCDRVCQVCGKTFHVSGTNNLRKYCSDRCRYEKNRHTQDGIERMHEQNEKDRVEYKSRRSAYSRTCHICGRPTNDYHCEFCRQKIRKGVSGSSIADGWEYIA